MKYSLMLDEIWKEYEFQAKTLRLAQKTVKFVAKQSEESNTISAKILSEIGFATSTFPFIDTDVERAQSENKSFVILSLWSVFERCLVEYLQQHIVISSFPIPEVGNLLQQQIVEAVEWWKVDEKLEIIKPLLTAKIVGQLKQIKKYRDWVAHRNPSASPSNIDPETTYLLLRDAVQQLEANS
jgi:hypothetical protein